MEYGSHPPSGKFLLQDRMSEGINAPYITRGVPSAAGFCCAPVSEAKAVPTTPAEEEPEKDRYHGTAPNLRCASSLRLVFTLGITHVVGIRRWHLIFSVSEMAFTSLICNRRCQCCTLRCVRSATRPRNNGRVLFVGTKRQASELVANAAGRCGQHYVNRRWLGGMLTNWETITASIKRLAKLDEDLGSEEISEGLTKKELLNLTRERDKLERSLGGIKNMGGKPHIMFVIDTNKESIAIAEGRKLRDSGRRCC